MPDGEGVRNVVSMNLETHRKSLNQFLPSAPRPPTKKARAAAARARKAAAKRSPASRAKPKANGGLAPKRGRPKRWCRCSGVRAKYVLILDNAAAHGNPDGRTKMTAEEEEAPPPPPPRRVHRKKPAAPKKPKKKPLTASENHQRWLNQWGFKVLYLPPRSPDINFPIETVWSIMQEWINKNLERGTTLEGFRKLIERAFAEAITEEVVTGLIDRMPEVLDGIIKAKGKSKVPGKRL